MAPRKMKKLEPLTVRLEPDTKAALDRLASELDRPLAWVINAALAAWLEGRGLDRSKLKVGL
jgi:predicted transcriptional regulator